MRSGMLEPQTTPGAEGGADPAGDPARPGRGLGRRGGRRRGRATGCPARDALRETLRRRRASGGPAEQTFATLVGLELRPRRLRAAAALWRLVGDRHGLDARDGIWAHPDLVPTAEDLDEPMDFADRLGKPAGEGNPIDDPIAAIERTEQAEEQAERKGEEPGDEA